MCVDYFFFHFTEEKTKARKGRIHISKAAKKRAQMAKMRSTKKRIRVVNEFIMKLHKTSELLFNMDGTVARGNNSNRNIWHIIKRHIFHRVYQFIVQFEALMLHSIQTKQSASAFFTIAVIESIERK